MNDMMDSLKNSASHITSYSYSFYMGTDKDGKTVVIESPPKIKTQVLIRDPSNIADGEDTINDALSLKVKDINSNNDKPVHKLGGYFNSANWLNDFWKTDKSFAVQPEAPEKLVQKDGEDKSSKGWDWLGCVSDRSGLPRWFLVTTVFFSVLAFVWLCFVTHATAPEHKVKSGQQGEYQPDKKDLQYMQFVDLYDEEYKLPEKVSLEPADVHQQQAPPLPIKMNIAPV